MDILLIIITFISICVSIYCVKNKSIIDKKIQIENDLIKQHNNDLLIDNKHLEQENHKWTLDNARLEERNICLSAQYEEEQNLLNNQKKLSQDAFENYCDVLSNNYEEYEKEYDDKILILKQSYQDKQINLLSEIDEIKAELKKIKATRQATIEALLREKELENNISYYCLNISDTDRADISKLNSLKISLNKPRVLSMLIWQTWFQKPLKTLASTIIGLSDKTGIYKITNIQTKECYIGQAVSIKDRWNEHAKCGLGIDTPANNKLYKAMQEYGLWNFAFEVLEECPRDQLNEKEKYYINLYNSYDLGYNSTRGNN